MAVIQSASEIVARFKQESRSISDYLHSLRRHSSFYRRELDLFNDALAEVDIKPIKFSPNKRPEQCLSLDETHALIAPIQKAIDEAHFQLNLMPDLSPDEPSFPESGPAKDWHLVFDVTIEAMMKRMPPNASAQEINRSFHGEFLAARSTNKKVPQKTIVLLADLANEFVRHRQHQNQISAMTYVLSAGKDLLIRARSAQPGTITHIFRQAFLLVITAFDAAAFDLVQAAVRGPLFAFVHHFGKSASVSIEQVQSAQNFDDLRAAIVEQQFRGLHLKELLTKLGKVGANLTKEKEDFGMLIEMVLRRNLHVHTGGIVDKQYMAANLNIYGLDIGELAVIDDSYFRSAVELTNQAIESISNWLASNPTPSE